MAIRKPKPTSPGTRDYRPDSATQLLNVAPTAVPDVRDGELVVPAGPGWGCDIREDVLRSHPVA